MKKRLFIALIAASALAGSGAVWAAVRLPLAPALKAPASLPGPLLRPPRFLPLPAAGVRPIEQRVQAHALALTQA